MRSTIPRTQIKEKKQSSVSFSQICNEKNRSRIFNDANPRNRNRAPIGSKLGSIGRENQEQNEGKINWRRGEKIEGEIEGEKKEESRPKTKRGLGLVVVFFFWWWLVREKE